MKKRKTPGNSSTCRGYLLGGTVMGDFPLHLQLSEDKKSEKLSNLPLSGAYRCTCTRIHQRGIDDRYRIHPGIILGTYVFPIPDPVMLVCMWITMVSFYGHFVLNGRVYKFLHKRKVIRYRKVKEESAEKNTQLKEGV